MEKKPNPPIEKANDEDPYKDLKIQELQLGIWNLKLAPEPGMNLKKRWTAIKAGFPLFGRLLMDIYHISPKLLAMLILCQFWDAIEDTLLLQQSNNLLKTLEVGLLTGKPNTGEIIRVVITRALWTLLVSWIAWIRQLVAEELEYKVTRHYELALMRTNLDTDLSTAQSPGGKQEASPFVAWYSLHDIIGLHTTLLQMASKMFLIFHLSRSSGGPLVVLLCAVQPICSIVFASDIWTHACFGFVNNVHHQRMEALRKLLDIKFKPDIISGGLARWIGDEFLKSHKALGSTSGRHPGTQLHYQSQRKSDIVIEFMRDLPMLFFAVNAVIHPEAFSVSSIAALHQTSTSLRSSIGLAFEGINNVHKSFLRIKMLYDSMVVVNSIRKGDTPYPHVPEKPNKMVDPSKGMSFQLKNLSFTYPGSQNPTPALNSISLTINPGDLIIIVGTNGSGKSTLIRLLARLYDPSSSPNSLLIDDHPAAEYRLEDLNRATTLLSQESLVYPLSLRENIGLGCPELVGEGEEGEEGMDMVREAARLGGAEGFVGRLRDGLETTLEPEIETYARNLYGKVTHPLYKEMQNIRKKIDISGGEKQRVVASRSFMRFNSGKIKFVAVDEPSSALDAEGELQLFKNLIAAREGKTMVFVTHRFGHLTKYANLIVCMKDGEIVESGTHAELMEKRGEYANLYKIQASAFSDVLI